MRCLDVPARSFLHATVSSTAALTSAATSKPSAGGRTLTALDVLAVRARGGNARALQAFLVALKPHVRAIVARAHARVGFVFSDDDVNEFVQELMIIAWRVDLPRWDESLASFAGFHGHRAAWHLRDALRVRGRRALSLDSLLDDGGDVADAHADPDALLDHAAHERQVARAPVALARALAESNAQEQRVVQLHDVEGQPLRVAAAALGVHVSNACRSRQKVLARAATHLAAMAA